MIKKLLGMILPVVLVILSSIPVLASNTSTITAKIPVECSDVGGTFVIEPQGLAPMPTKESITVADKGEGSFTVTFDQPDNYSYVIKQIAGNKSGVTYDKSVYNVTVHVIYDEKEMLKAELEIRKKDAELKSESAKYDNVSKKNDKKSTAKRTGGSSGTGSGSKSNVKTSDPAEIGKYALMSAGCMLVLVLAVISKTREQIRRLKS